MEHIDMILYTIVVVGLFVSFGISTFAEFKKMHNRDYTGLERSDDRKAFASFVGRIFG